MFSDGADVGTLCWTATYPIGRGSSCGQDLVVVVASLGEFDERARGIVFSPGVVGGGKQVTTDNPATWSELNWTFHSNLYQPAGMPRLLRSIESLRARTATYVAAFRGWDLPESADAEHREILSAYRDRDTERATVALVSHLEASRIALHRLFPDT